MDSVNNNTGVWGVPCTGYFRRQEEVQRRDTSPLEFCIALIVGLGALLAVATLSPIAAEVLLVGLLACLAVRIVLVVNHGGGSVFLPRWNFTPLPSFSSWRPMWRYYPSVRPVHVHERPASRFHSPLGWVRGRRPGIPDQR